jgi:iron complex transport system substrate-binding protein
MRIISLVPNGTEILFALGAGSEVVGVSHECDFPPAARRLPVLTGSALASGLSAPEVDLAVSAQLAGGESLYTIDEERLAGLAPDLIVTQRLCPVCAVSEAQVDSAVRPLRRCPELLWLDPKTLGEVWSDIARVGKTIGRVGEATALLSHLEERLRAVESRVGGRPRPRVLALEWLDPPFAGGHWVPEMIAAAGGEDALGTVPGQVSRRLSWEEIGAASPEVVIAMPCGFDRVGAAAQVACLTGRPEWQQLAAVRAENVYAVDANGCFSRPGPRLVDGIEMLAALLHPTPSVVAAPVGARIGG